MFQRCSEKLLTFIFLRGITKTNVGTTSEQLLKGDH